MPSFLLESPDVPVGSLGSFAVGRLELDTGEEALGQPPPVVAQLGGVDGARVLGVHDGGALVALHPLPRLKLYLGLVATPGTVGQCKDSLAALIQAQARGLHRDVMDEVALRVVAHRGCVSVAQKKKKRKKKSHAPL